MSRELIREVSAADLAREIGLEYSGPTDAQIFGVASLEKPRPRFLTFIKEFREDLDDAVVLIAPSECDVSQAHIKAAEPRLAFAKALHWLALRVGFRPRREQSEISPSSRISETAVIGDGVLIGDNTEIGHNVVIGDGATIGSDCLIRSNSVIGEKGFGFQRDESGRPVALLHLGSVVIGDRVEIGALNSVCSGTIEDTVIEDDVKTDNLVHIAHNCIVRRGALLTACAELSGGVEVGEYSWIGPNAAIMQKLRIGAGAFVGIAANVTKDVEPGAVVAGNPARKLR